MNGNGREKVSSGALPPVIGAKQVAHLLNYRAVESFYTKRRQLEALGFPAKLPGINGWSSRAVLRWIDPDSEPEAAPSRRNLLEEVYAQ